MNQFSLGFAILLAIPFSTKADEATNFGPTKCEGDYKYHLQGVCSDRKTNLYWSFTTDLVKTDSAGKVIKQIPVDNHHGDLCFHEGKIYVAVNLGRFNDPEGNADSWVYVYDSDSLEEISRHEVQEVFHGAGGMDVRDGHFYIVGGLPDGVEENYAYEYDESFQFVKKHIIPSGWTRLGIQTAAWQGGAWWFGCYGSPKILLKTDRDFQMLGRYEFDCSLGIIGIDKDQFLVAKGPKTEANRCRGTLHLAKPDMEKGLVFLPE